MNSCAHGGGGEVAGELLDFRLQPTDVRQRAFGQDGKLLGLPGEKFTAKCDERLVHPFELFNSLGQDRFGFHKVSRNSPFRAPGFSRT